MASTVAAANTQFPLDFPFQRALLDPLDQIAQAPFVVGAMISPSHAAFGERLAASCRAFALPLALFEVPGVHQSISPKGCDNLQFTKANFIHFLMERYQRPVLYLDADCVIAQRPAQITALLAAEVDFAIFNWLAEEHTEAYIPVQVTVREPQGTRVTDKRFYRFSHSIDRMSTSQLICSGAAQWYNNSAPARRLLAEWQALIRHSPRSADDQCLDFAFNNYPANAPKIKTVWFDKSYARYSWWIYVKPVINHPEIPCAGALTVPIDQYADKQRVYWTATQPHPVQPVIPRDCLIDTATSMLLRMQQGALQPAGRFAGALWL